MPNIGKLLESRLIAAGIESGEQLRSLGSMEAFGRLREVDRGACLSALFALEGAIRDTRWHLMSDDVKAALKQHFVSLPRR